MDNIRALFKKLNYAGEYHFIEYNADEEFKGLPSLLGDLTPYGRLLIPQFIDARRVLYLDSDLIIEIDLLNLRDLAMEGYAIAAVSNRTIEHSLDLEYFLGRGYPKDMLYFNSGILLIDIDAWKEQNITAVWRDILTDQPETIPTVDQTILNRVCAGGFKRLPLQYNAAFLPHHAKPNYDKAIFHFVGSPKPWDFLGRVIHSGYALWKRYSPPFWEKEYQQMTVARVGRAWHIRRSLARTLQKRYMG